MTQRFLLLLFFNFVLTSIFGQTQKTFFIGHSLTDNIPEMVQSLSVNHGGVGLNWRFQSIPGSSLEYQWTRKNPPNSYTPTPPAYYGFFHPTEGLQAGNFNSLVLTESVPRDANSPYGIPVTYQYADSFYNYATTYNPAIKVYVYEVWHCLQSGTPTGCAFDVNSNPWRQRLTDDLPMWESVVDTLRNRFNAQSTVCLIPGGQGLARLYESIQVGAIPGISSINQLFSDDIHLTDVGRYFIACIHFSMIHQVSPVGLTNQLYNIWGGPFTAPTPAQALKFQQIAWATATSYPKSCINNVVLNARFLTIGAQANNNGNTINWSASDDASSYQFFVERSLDGVVFNSIANIAKANTTSGTNNYQYVDNNTFPVPVYYRIRCENDNGKKNYSDIVSVSAKQRQKVFLVGTSSSPTIAVKGLQANSIIHIFNAQGASVLSTTNSTINTSTWPSGLYFIKTESTTLKYLKQ